MDIHIAQPALGTRSTGDNQDFVLQYPVLTFGILGVIFGFILLLCLFLLIRHAQPEWYLTITARLPYRHSSSSRAVDIAHDETYNETRAGSKRTKRFSGLLDRINDHPASFTDFGRTRSKARTVGTTPMSYTSTSHSSIWSQDAEKGQTSFDSDAGVPLRAPDRALQRGDIGRLGGGGQAGQGIMSSPTVQSSSAQRSAAPRGGAGTRNESHEAALAAGAVTATPTRVPSLPPALPHSPSASSRAVTQPVLDPPSTSSKTDSPRVSPPSPAARSSSRQQPRPARPAMHSRHTSTPAIGHSPISPSNLRKSYVPAEAEVITATRSSIVRPVMVLLTPTYRASRSELSSAMSMPTLVPSAVRDTGGREVPMSNDDERETVSSGAVDFSARQSYIALPSPDKSS